LRSADKKEVTRRTLVLTAPAIDEPTQPVLGESDPGEVSVRVPIGEIISISSNTTQETTEALQAAAARLRALLSSLDDLIFELDN
jgi:PAS domain-containing protein